MSVEPCGLELLFLSFVPVTCMYVISDHIMWGLSFFASGSKDFVILTRHQKLRSDGMSQGAVVGIDSISTNYSSYISGPLRFGMFFINARQSFRGSSPWWYHKRYCVAMTVKWKQFPIFSKANTCMGRREKWLTLIQSRLTTTLPPMSGPLRRRSLLKCWAISEWFKNMMMAWKVLCDTMRVL